MHGNNYFTGCGGVLTELSSRVFTTPNYPSHYQPGIVCDWIIRADHGNTIEVTIDSFEFDSSNNCRFDGLFISNSFNFKNHTISRLCHHTDSSVVVSSNGHEMFLRFEADLFLGAKGFNGSFEIVREGKFLLN